MAIRRDRRIDEIIAETLILSKIAFELAVRHAIRQLLRLFGGVQGSGFVLSNCAPGKKACLVSVVSAGDLTDEIGEVQRRSLRAGEASRDLWLQSTTQVPMNVPCMATLLKDHLLRIQCFEAWRNQTCFDGIPRHKLPNAHVMGGGFRVSNEPTTILALDFYSDSPYSEKLCRYLHRFLRELRTHSEGDPCDWHPAARVLRGQLTDRQLQVLGLMLCGWSARQIEYELGVAMGTVKAHMQAIHSKLDADTYGEVLAKCAGTFQSYYRSKTGKDAQVGTITCPLMGERIPTCCCPVRN